MEEGGRSEIERARDAGLKWLGRRALTVRELRERLSERCFFPETIERVIEEFQRLRLLDDRKFAREWVESRMRRRPVGALRLACELRERGIEEDVVEQVLEEFGEDLDAASTAISLLRRQKWRYSGLEEMKAKRRMLGFLKRRGYQLEVIRQAVDKVWEELQRNEVQRD